MPARTHRRRLRPDGPVARVSRFVVEPRAFWILSGFGEPQWKPILSISIPGRWIPLKVAVQQKEQSVRLTVYDDTYFVAFDILHLEDVTVTAGPDVACQLAIEKTKVKPQWPGQYMPDQLVIRFKESS